MAFLIKYANRHLLQTGLFKKLPAYIAHQAIHSFAGKPEKISPAPVFIPGRALYYFMY